MSGEEQNRAEESRGALAGRPDAERRTRPVAVRITAIPYAEERSFLLPCMALAFGLGVWLAPNVGAGLWPLWLMAAAAALAFALKLLRAPLRWACLPLLLMAGLFWAQTWLNAPRPEAGSYGEITATVYGDPAERTDGRIALTLCSVVLDGDPQPGKAYCTLNPSAGVSADRFFDGATLRFSGRVYHPEGQQNAYDFDFRLWLNQNGIAYGISSVKDLSVLNTPATAPWASYAARVRAALSERLRLSMGEEYPLAMAMLLGDRSALAEEEQTAFERAGVAHLMSVSGLHVGLLTAALLWLLNRLTVKKAFRLPITAVFLLLYCGITGFSAATVRASVMLLLWLTAQIAGRKPSTLVTLSAAALIVLAINPLQLFSAGFALSFSAMAGIMLLYPRFLTWLSRRDPVPAVRRKRGLAHRMLQRLGRRIGKPREVLAVSLAAQIGVLLPTAAFFHKLPLYGILFNLLAVPLAGLLVPLYALTLLLSALPWIGTLLAGAAGSLAALGSRGLLGLVELSAKLPYAQIRIAVPNVWAYAALLGAVVAASRYVRAKVGRRVLAAGLCVAIACAGAYIGRPAAVRYHQFAVGQGDSALIVDGNLTLAVDAGPYGGELAARLLAEGRDLDLLIITHLHQDHVYGLKTLLDEGIVIRSIALPSGAQTAADEESQLFLNLIRQSGVPVTELAAGDTLRFQDVSLDVLWPGEGNARTGIDPNDRSLAMLIRLNGLRLLSMGDNGSLYDRYIAKPCDVLKVGHHGSNDGTDDDFLDIADPALALVTCQSEAALPGQETLARLNGHGVRVLRTDRTGEIILSVREADRYEIATFHAGGSDGL